MSTVWRETDVNGVVIHEWDDSGIAGQSGTFTDFTVSPAATRTYQAWEQARADADLQTQTTNQNMATLLSKAQTALNNNITYLGIASPTQAQAVTQVGALTRQVNALIRYAMGHLDSTAGT